MFLLGGNGPGPRSPTVGRLAMFLCRMWLPGGLILIICTYVRNNLFDLLAHPSLALNTFLALSRDIYGGIRLMMNKVTTQSETEKKGRKERSSDRSTSVDGYMSHAFVTLEVTLEVLGGLQEETWYACGHLNLNKSTTPPPPTPRPRCAQNILLYLERGHVMF
jgi:hypothetical protein